MNVINKEVQNWTKNNKGKALGMAFAKLLSFGAPGAVAATAPFLFTKCDNGTTEKPAQPITVTIDITADKYPNLSPGAKITVVFPANFNATRLEAIRGKLVEAVNVLNSDAGKSNGFKTKINAILSRGLKITIEETKELSYQMKVADNQLVVETAYLEHAGVGGGRIAAWIIGLINEGQLVAKVRQSNNVYMAKGQVEQKLKVYDGQQKRNNLLAKMGQRGRIYGG